MKDEYIKWVKLVTILSAMALLVLTFYDPIKHKIVSNQFDKRMEQLRKENPDMLYKVRCIKRDTTNCDTINELDNTHP